MGKTYKTPFTSIRVYPATRSKLAWLADYFAQRYSLQNRDRWWKGDGPPTANEVIEFLLKFHEAYRARRDKAGKERTNRNRAKRAAGLQT